MNPSVKPLLATVLCALGLALAVYLALLKLYSLPCLGPGNCHSVIYSGYGTVLRLPVGVYAAALWTTIILVPAREKRIALLALLSLGAVAFMGIQFFVLHSLCIYCTSHAVVSWLAFLLSAQRPHRWAVLLGLALAAGGFGATRHYVSSRSEFTQAASDPRAPLATAPAGVAWLGKLAPSSPALVLSLDCAACLDLLEELTKQNYGDHVFGPAIFFKSTGDNEDLTLEFVADVLSAQGDRRDNFLAITSLLLAHKDAALSAPQVAVAELSATFHVSGRAREEARQLIGAQQKTLGLYKTAKTTPLLVLPNGHSRSFFKVEDLFPR